MKKHFVLCAVLLAILVSAAPAFAETRLDRYHSSASFNSPVGARFFVYWPCTTDWTAWGVTSDYKEVLVNWDDCEEGEQSRTCWVYDCDQWVEVTCP